MLRPNCRTRFGALAAIAGIALAGCAQQGGETTCADYQKMSDADQRTQVTALYKDKHGDEPSGLIVTGLTQQAIVYCQTVGKPDSKIKEIPIS